MHTETALKNHQTHHTEQFSTNFSTSNDLISDHPQLLVGSAGLIAQDVLFGDFGEAAVLPCFGAAACKELFSPVGPAATTEPFLGAGFIYPPLAQ